MTMREMMNLVESRLATGASLSEHDDFPVEIEIQEDEDPCWDGYKQLGMKTKGEKQVPNCVKVDEATYQGRDVPLNKPMQGDVKKFKVYVDTDHDGKATKVNFGDKTMRIKKNNPKRRKSFRARHDCDNPGPKDKARYWSCRKW
jgi:hypothetical protein